MLFLYCRRLKKGKKMEVKILGGNGKKKKLKEKLPTQEFYFALRFVRLDHDE